MINLHKLIVSDVCFGKWKGKTANSYVIIRLWSFKDGNIRFSKVGWRRKPCGL